jgi:uncharacterized protein YoxC
MINLNTKKLILIIFLLLSTQSKPITQDAINLIKNTALASAIVFGLYKFTQWLFYESNEKIIARQEKELQKYFTIFRPAISTIETEYPIRQLDTNTKINLTNDVNEKLLYQLYPLTKAISSTSNYIQELNNLVYNLQKGKSVIEKRIRQFSYRNNINKLELKKLKEIYEKTTYQLVSLEFLNTLIQNHKSYFQLTESYINYSNIYQKELNLLDTSSAGIYLGYELKRCALIQFKKARYPYSNFEEKISKDIDKLSETIYRSAYNYQSLIYYLNQLLHKLRTIHEYILTDPDYYQEKQKRESDSREEERILIAQREATAKEQLARAREKQAQAAFQYNQILLNKKPNRQIINIL